MSRARRCDRCGMFYEDLAYEVTIREVSYCGRTPIPQDLCCKCFEDFKKFMENREERKEVTNL